WLDMTSYDHPVTSALYLTVLKKSEPSPLLPESDEEKAAAAAADSAPRAPAVIPSERSESRNLNSPAGGDSVRTPRRLVVTIDTAGLAQRTIAVPCIAIRG